MADNLSDIFQNADLSLEDKSKILADIAARAKRGEDISTDALSIKGSSGKLSTGPVFATPTTGSEVGGLGLPKQRGALSIVGGVPTEEPETPPTPPEVGALSQVAPAVQRNKPVDIAEMLQKFVPQDDSSSRYLAMAAAFSRPTTFGSFGETMGNVANALLEQRQNQQKLRAQYAPLIMQQVAAQQSREEQAFYRQEAQQQAQQAQIQAARMAQQGRMDLAAQNQLGRVDIATQNQQALAERAAEALRSREQIASDRLEASRTAEKLAGKAPPGYAWGPVGQDGNPTMIAVKGGPADTKLAGVLNADTMALTNSISSFDRLGAAANQVLNHPGLPGITGLKGALPNIPGGAAADAQALLGTLKSQIGFGVLQDMRNNSKTGGALGNVSDAEGKRLESNLAALEKSQSLEQFQTSLRQILDYSEKAKDRMREAYNLKHGDVRPAPDATPVGGMPSMDAVAAEIARRKKGQ